MSLFKKQLSLQIDCKHNCSPRSPNKRLFPDILALIEVQTLETKQFSKPMPHIYTLIFAELFSTKVYVKEQRFCNPKISPLFAVF